MQQRQPCPCNGIDTPDNKIRVLKKPEDGKVSAQINDQCGFCLPRTVIDFKVLDQPPIRIIKYNRKQHD